MSLQLFSDNRLACFNDDRSHRYLLSVMWDVRLPVVCFIGLNPSTANEFTNDPTINKVCKIAKFNGYGTVRMLNLFSVVSADPKILERRVIDIHTDGINASFVRDHVRESADVVFCWGNFKEGQERGNKMIKRIDGALCIEQNKNGSPKHPLYCLDESRLKSFNSSFFNSKPL